MDLESLPMRGSDVLAVVGLKPDMNLVHGISPARDEPFHLGSSRSALGPDYRAHANARTGYPPGAEFEQAMKQSLGLPTGSPGPASVFLRKVE
jgi:hypothetical protein